MEKTLFARSSEGMVYLSERGFEIVLDRTKLESLRRLRGSFEKSLHRKISLEEVYIGSVYGLSAIRKPVRRRKGTDILHMTIGQNVLETA